MEAVDPADLAARIARGDRPVIVDMRSGAEFAAGHVPGAVNIPFWRFLVAGATLPPSDEPVVIYCGHGPRAQMAAAALRARGVGPMVQIAGHWAAWERTGLPRART
jgi:rhodanese-related sulfurtransferase